MNDRDLDAFEAELRALKPAPAPPELVERLQAAPPARQPVTLRPPWRWPIPWRWLAPATAVAALALAYGLWQHRPGDQPAPAQATADQNHQVPAPDEVEIDRQLVTSYDAVAELSSGLPVRFHCQEWEDRLVFRDPRRGIAIERRTPRVEVIRISLDTY